jgi:hypothetical protein
MAFKSYCWSVGTTSFRVKQLNYKIEKQLQMLNRLYSENEGSSWDVDLQLKYYEIMLNEDFVEGMPDRPEKDARQKTSGLADIGVINRNREITEIGEKILHFTEDLNIESQNILGISYDSYVYLLQLLKFQVTNASGTKLDESITIKPFLALIHMLNELDYLTYDEFTYLLPVCKSQSEVLEMIELIQSSRQDGVDINVDEIIVQKILNMDNYNEMLEFFLAEEILTCDTFMKIGMNRKSPSYDAGYFDVYHAFLELYNGFSSTEEDSDLKLLVENVVNSFNSINGNQSKMWKRFFNLGSRNKIDKEFIERLRQINIFGSNNLAEFKQIFFLLLHTFKWKLTLLDYYDLNMRYISLTDVVKFSNVIELTLAAKYYFEDISSSLLGEPNLSDDDYFESFYSFSAIDEISPIYYTNPERLQSKIYEKTGVDLSGSDIEDYFEDEKNKEFIQLIDSKFPKSIIIELLEAFITRDDDIIYSLITENATPSTSFEYILGIVWYNLSGRKGKILDFLNLSLDSNYLPKTHAAGGNADIVFNYDDCPDYPRHDLLIEATLSESGGQRQMEMEPVTRHLTRHLQLHERDKDYVIFIATRLYKDLILDFRNRKSIYYETNSGLEKQGMKIIPIDVTILIEIINKEIGYKDIYELFEEAYKSTVSDLRWHEDEIINKIQEIV